MKATPHSFLLAAYLPIPKFINISVPVQAALTTCIYHSCLTIVTENSQQDAWGGIEIPDPLGHICVCYPTFVSWIADLPKHVMNEHFFIFYLSITEKGLNKKWPELGHRTRNEVTMHMQHHTALLHHHMG